MISLVFFFSNSADANVGTELPVWVPQSDLQVSQISRSSRNDLTDFWE